MKKATLVHHQGFGDLITNNPICNYYSEQYDELIIFVLDESRKKVVSEMYKHKKNILFTVKMWPHVKKAFKKGCHPI
jgi:hypothetical protein